MGDYNWAGILRHPANHTMIRNLIAAICIFFLGSSLLLAQGKRLWVLNAPGEITEYDAATFAQKQSVKVPAEAVGSPQNFLVNHLGQMLFAPSSSLPLSADDIAGAGNVWFWNGRSATTLAREVTRTTAQTGSNLEINESASIPYLGSDGVHLFWFANQARRLQRDGVDLTTRTAWSARQTDLGGLSRQELAEVELPECSCPTGSCEDTCPYGQVWVPDAGVGDFFLMTEFVAGRDQPVYKATALYRESAGKWTATAIDPPLRRVLDAANSSAILEAIPDTGCCGWANRSDDQTLLHLQGRTIKVFDELSAYDNPDYDVSFYTETGKLSPDLKNVALAIVATSQPNTPIQLAEQGQANPEESLRIRKALTELPAVEVKSIEETAKRVAFLPHATLVGWINEQEILIVEGHLLVAYNVASGAQRKSIIHVEDRAHVFLR